MRCVCGGGCGERCGVCLFMVKQSVNCIHKKFDIIHMLIFTRCLCGGCLQSQDRIRCRHIHYRHVNLLSLIHSV